MKLLFIDLETTGLDYTKHGIISIGGIVDVNGDTKDKFKIDCRPFPGQFISKTACSIHGITPEEIAMYQSPEDAYVQLKEIFNRHVDRYNSKDKFIWIGYNSYFDNMFLRTFFEKNGDNYFSSYFWWPTLDVASLLCERIIEQRPKIDSFSLESICKILNIETDAHNALEDAEATRQIYYKLREE